MCDRERLIELIAKAQEKYSEYIEDWITHLGEDDPEKAEEWIADYLLANGVSVLPVPIGAVVYEFRARGERRYGYRKYDYGISTNYMLHNAMDWGAEIYVKEKPFTKTDKIRLNHTVFLTKDEAEERLKKITGGA